MKVNILFCLLAVVALILFLRYINIPSENFTKTSSGICFKASQYGADPKFVKTCSTYQSICGEDSTSTLVHQIDGEVGLNSIQADSMIQNSLGSAKKGQCCDPNNPDTSFCTGN